jgi:hypothetical protein
LLPFEATKTGVFSSDYVFILPIAQETKLFAFAEVPSTNPIFSVMKGYPSFLSASPNAAIFSSFISRVISRGSFSRFTSTSPNFSKSFSFKVLAQPPHLTYHFVTFRF